MKIVIIVIISLYELTMRCTVVAAAAAVDDADPAGVCFIISIDYCRSVVTQPV